MMLLEVNSNTQTRHTNKKSSGLAPKQTKKAKHNQNAIEKTKANYTLIDDYLRLSTTNKRTPSVSYIL